MSTHTVLPTHRGSGMPNYGQFDARGRRMSGNVVPVHFSGQNDGDEGGYRQAELFYLQKQIQSQTPMVIVLEDGEQIEGQIEWYDRNSIKVRGRARTLVYKAAIKYMYKLGETGAS
jgi:sRNA-binding regulator protein Hfq